METDKSTQKMLAAVRALLEEVLDSESPTRFAEAARVCEIAHSLVQARSAAVGAFAGVLPNQEVFGFGADGPPVMPLPRARREWNNLNVNGMNVHANPRDNQAQRDAAMAADLVAQSQVEANRAAVSVVQSRASSSISSTPRSAYRRTSLGLCAENGSECSTPASPNS